MAHMLKAWPGVLAGKILHAREHLIILAFEKYLAENSHLQCSLLVQCRYHHNTGHGLRGRDVTATEIGQMVASLTNSSASAFWMVYHIFADAVVLKECREEVEKLVQVVRNGTCIVDLARIRSSCPVLLSTGQEILRYSHNGIIARVVMKDVVLANQYLLKKGATVMSATPVQHTDRSIWGPNINGFDHRRFLREVEKNHTNPAAFRAFGGGTVLCPGRHFVSTDVFVVCGFTVAPFRPEARNSRWEVGRAAEEFPYDILYADTQRQGTSGDRTKRNTW